MRAWLQTLGLMDPDEGERTGGRYASVAIAALFLLFLDILAYSLLAPTPDGVSLSLYIREMAGYGTLLLAAVLLVRNGLPLPAWIACSALLSALVFAARRFSSSNLLEACQVFLCAAAAFSVFQRYPGRAVQLLNGRDLHSYGASLAAGALTGLVLGLIGALLFMRNGAPAFQFSAQVLWDALDDAVLSEVCFRLIFAAACVDALKGAVYSRTEAGWYLAMLAAPHSLTQAAAWLPEHGLWGLLAALAYIVFFGLPFALLYREKGLLPAILAHFVMAAILLAA